jgi:hypothetical protein
LLVPWLVVGGGLIAELAQAAVVVVANRTDRDVICSMAPVWGETRQYAITPGKLIAVQVSDQVQVAFNSGKTPVRIALDPNTVHYFVTQEGRLALRRVQFAQSPGNPWLSRQQQTAPPPSAVVPVKLLVDDEQPAVRAKWESELRGQVAAASQFLEVYCGVRFDVVAVDTWTSDNNQKDFAALDQEFRQKVNPEPGWLAIGMTSQYQISDGTPLRHLPREPLCSHLLLPDIQKKLPKGDHLELLVHELGHYLGAVHCPEPTSVMRGTLLEKDKDKGKQADHRRVGVTIIDPVNTLVMNLLGEEIRVRGARNLAAVPRGTRQYLQAIYSELARGYPQDTDLARYVSLVQDPEVKTLRYLGRWADGSLLAGDAVAPWQETKSTPALAGKNLLDNQNPIRWLVDTTIPPAEAPSARVEIVGGDCLPGRVVGFRNGEETPNHRLPPHVLVSPHVALDWPDDAPRTALRVSMEWIRRIVWTPVATSYQPQTLFFTDGRELSFRAVRFGETSLKVLGDDGIREVALGEVAELHMPAVDPWEAYFQQLAVLSPEGASRLVQLETSGGLRLTCSLERFQARARSGEPSGWYHLFQPAWSLDTLWVQHTTVRLRCFYQPQEVPLSRIEPVMTRQRADLGGVWPWRMDRNCEGGTLESGSQQFQWGIGVHALCELEFPLPALARSFRTALGLDRIVGDGGCAQAAVLLRPSSGKPLYVTNLLIGSADVFDTGPLALGEARDGQPRRLVLLVDPAAGRRPASADPFDIRDHFDWLEPLVELDAEKLKDELPRRGPERIPAWKGWKVTNGDEPRAHLVNRWDESEASNRSFRLLSLAQKSPLKLARRLKIDPDHYRLLVALNRPPDTSASKLDVLVDGQPFAQLEVPLRFGAETPEPLVVLLSQFAGREIDVELVQQSSDERGLIEWRALTLTGRPDELAVVEWKR